MIICRSTDLMPDMVSLVITEKRAGRFTIGNDHNVSMNDCSILELHAWEALLDVNDFLAQAKLATCLKGSSVKDLLVVRSSYR